MGLRSVLASLLMLSALTLCSGSLALSSEPGLSIPEHIAGLPLHSVVETGAEWKERFPGRSEFLERVVGPLGRELEDLLMGAFWWGDETLDLGEAYSLQAMRIEGVSAEDLRERWVRAMRSVDDASLPAPFLHPAEAVGGGSLIPTVLPVARTGEWAAHYVKGENLYLMSGPAEGLTMIEVLAEFFPWEARDDLARVFTPTLLMLETWDTRGGGRVEVPDGSVAVTFPLYYWSAYPLTEERKEDMRLADPNIEQGVGLSTLELAAETVGLLPHHQCTMSVFPNPDGDAVEDLVRRFAAGLDTDQHRDFVVEQLTLPAGPATVVSWRSVVANPERFGGSRELWTYAYAIDDGTSIYWLGCSSFGPAEDGYMHIAETIELLARE